MLNRRSWVRSLFPHFASAPTIPDTTPSAATTATIASQFIMLLLVRRYPQTIRRVDGEQRQNARGYSASCVSRLAPNGLDSGGNTLRKRRRVGCAGTRWG